jgi:hypothetical protein
MLHYRLKLDIKKFILRIGAAFAILVLSPTILAQHNSEPGSPDEPVRVLSNGIDMDMHDGGLRPAIGIENIQILRANRTNAHNADKYGWTYSHAPMLAYWNDKFYLQYLSNPVAEHQEPGMTLITTSTDGRNWDTLEPVFPIYFLRPGFISTYRTGTVMMHQRMGFYVAPNGRLLVSGFYGEAPSPWGEHGIGRVVREAYEDGSYGPIYFIRYNRLSEYDESNTTYPFYKRSNDNGFIEACDALLADRLKTMQWREEERSADDGFFTLSTGSSPSVYHRKDGVAVAHFKSSLAALSTDRGETWSTPVQIPSIVTAGAKTWGQRTADGRFALLYIPAPYNSHRWPLALVTSDDGIVFDNMLLVHGEVPPQRFSGRAKDFGPQYIRGISEGNGNPPHSDMWITYSVNKEDIWISRIPLPIRHSIEGPVEDSFDDLDVGGKIPNWNIYRTQWAVAEIAAFPSSQNKSLRLSDRDPYDYAKAVRVFEETKSVRIALKLHAKQIQNGRLEIEVLDHFGHRPIRIVFDESGYLLVNDGSEFISAGSYDSNLWHQIGIAVNVSGERFDLSIDGRAVVQQAQFAESVASVERLSFRTGPYRTEPRRETDRYGFLGDLPKADDPVPIVVYYIDDLSID